MKDMTERQKKMKLELAEVGIPEALATVIDRKEEARYMADYVMVRGGKEYKIQTIDCELDVGELF